MITVNELFSGIGSQRAALERLHIPHEIVGIAEIDKYAIQSYEAIYGKTRNYGDISKIDKLDYADFWTYSFPCTDISVAGKQEGIIKGKTRSGLLYEVQRLLEASWQANELPKYLMLENVKNLVGKKFKPQFDEWIGWLDELGYNSYYQVLNAKNYGIPQNRERVFAISIRKDIDNGGFEFPQPFDNGIRLKDILEKEVDEKYYLSEKTIAGYNRHKERNAESGNGFGWKPTKGETVASALLTSSSKSNANFIIDTNRCIQVGDLHHYGYDEMNRVYSKDRLSPTLRTMTGGDRQPRFLESEPFIAASRANFERTSTFGATGVSNGIRKLTPKEYWRLMGFTDDAFEKAEKVCSNSQLYKQAGNSIVVDVLYYIFKNLFDENYKRKSGFVQTSLF